MNGLKEQGEDKEGSVRDLIRSCKIISWYNSNIFALERVAYNQKFRVRAVD